MGMTAFTLDALIRLDDKEFNKSLTGAEGKVSKFSTGLSKVGDVAKKAAGFAVTTVTAAATAIAGIASSAIEAYSEYEQNIGGVETLFKDSADNVIKYAHDAYLTAGVDANTYMSNVTSFSAALLQGLGGDTEKAAEVANRAMIDMSDNTNKMGTSIESIQTAYQGFAKQNYTMLDNLKLGYGGTQAEMQRLIQDAAKMTDVQEKLGLTVDASSMSFDNIINAISVMQEHLGIAGTTAEEASTTIQGSIGMMQASWENLKIAFVDPDGDIDAALSAFIGSVKTAAENMIPAVSRALQGIGAAVRELAPVLAEELPGLVSTLLPDITSAAISLVNGLVTAIIDSLPVIMDAGVQIINSLVEMISNNASSLADAAVTIVTTLLGAITENLPTLLSAGVEIVGQIATSIGENLPTIIPAVVDLLLQIITTLTDPENAEMMVGAAVAIIQGLADGLVAAIPTLIAAIPTIITNVVTALTEQLPVLLEAVGTALTSIMDGIIEGVGPYIESAWTDIQAAAEAAWAVITEVVSGAWDSVVEVWNTVAQWFQDNVWQPLLDFVTSAWGSIVESVSGAWASIEEAWNTAAQWFEENIWQPIVETVSSAWTSVEEAWNTAAQWFQDTVWQPIVDFFTTAWESISEFWADPLGNITSAWETVAGWIDENVWQPINNFFTVAWEAVQEFWNDPLGAITAAWETVAGWVDENVWQPIKDFFDAMWGGVQAFWDDPLGTISSAWSGVAEWIGNNVTGPIVEFFNGVINTITSAINSLLEFLGLSGSAQSGDGRTVTPPSIDEEGLAQHLSGMTNDQANQYLQANGMFYDSESGHFGWLPGNAKGVWSVPYDDYVSRLHRGEMVLTASQARQYRDGEEGGSGDIVAAIQGLRNDLTNLKLVIGEKAFGEAVVDYGGYGMSDYIGGAESNMAYGYGT